MLVDNGSAIEEGTRIENCEHASTVNQIRFKNVNTVATCGDDNQLKIFNITSKK